MKKFHITIKDNEENVVAFDRDVDVILGACSSDDDDKTTGIGYSSCTGKTLLNVMDTMFKVMKRAGTDKDGDPMLWKYAVASMLKGVIADYED